ncbi:hypothetical protein LJC49_05105 [Ruminococcaceae bacterium OttesenSCG-928-I18]|nr:hypothetical protein [Ruminococcaceae bacterium OttesenSCG-928-I18]
MHMFGNHILVKKSTILVVGVLAVAGCLLYRHYRKSGNLITDDLEEVAEKGKRTAKKVADEAKD